MSTAELTAFNIFRKELNLSDESATKLIDAIEELQQKKTDKSLLEFKSIFKDDFHQIYLKMEQLNTKIESSKNATIIWLFGMFLALAMIVLFKN